MADLITAADVAAVPELQSLAGRTDLADLITAASDLVVARIGRPVLSATVTETFSGNGKPRLWLSARPVTSITSVTINGIAIDNTSGDAWVFDAETGKLQRGNGKWEQRFADTFPRGTNNIAVVYVGGAVAVPPRLKRATLALLKWATDSIKRSGLYQSESLGDYSYTLGTLDPTSLPPSVEAWLKGYIDDFVF